jgi:hypothetical protein
MVYLISLFDERQGDAMKIDHSVWGLVVISVIIGSLVFGLAAATAEEPKAPFSSYKQVPVNLPGSYTGYSLPINRGDITNLDHYALSDARVKALLKNGFFVTPGQYKEFFQIYNEAPYSQNPPFITTDSMLHVFHLIFDKVLRDLERQRFSPDLIALTTACRKEAEGTYRSLKGTEMADPALRVLAYFSTAESLLVPGAPVPPEAARLVSGELALINSASGLEESVVFPKLVEDWSQYVPRGHYTRSDTLKRYFRAMMYYGRITFRLKDRSETESALMVTYILTHAKAADGTAASSLWERIYEPTSFFVGGSDDPSFKEYKTVADRVFGADAAPETFADKKLLTQFIEEAAKLPAPRINSMWVTIFEDKEEATRGFRFMGSRFVIDAFIFENLIWRRVGTMDNPRMLPSPLDVMAAMGSPEAYAILEKKGETGYKNYPENMERMKAAIAALSPSEWTRTLYSAWLYALMPLVEPKDARYPAFMRTVPWATKGLNSAVGSYTELKHDTILYAKQVMAEAGGEEIEPLKGFVEPEPLVYSRLLSLARMMRQGLGARGLLSEDQARLMEDLDSDVSFLLDVSVKELNRQSLDDAANDRLMYWGEHLEWMTLSAADTEGEGRPYFEDTDAALVADVATDPNGAVLELATGRINEIYVAVPDGAGRLVLTRGGVFSTYEFTVPLSERMTDESWKEKLAGPKAPAPPEWTGVFIVK